MAKLYFHYGVMGSSKSANALMVRRSCGERVTNSRIGLRRKRWKEGNLGPDGGARP